MYHYPDFLYLMASSLSKNRKRSLMTYPWLDVKKGFFLTISQASFWLFLKNVQIKVN